MFFSISRKKVLGSNLARIVIDDSISLKFYEPIQTRGFT